MDTGAVELTVLDRLPDGFLTAEPAALHRLLPGPTLLHLAGRGEPPLFVSVLLHGDEDTGLRAAQRLLRRYRPGGGAHELPRSLSLFVGNVAAAAAGVRRLPGQPDYNRVWPGSGTGGTPEHALMRRVFEEMRARGVFASVDVHNNTGLNPHYACVNRRDPRFLNLASLFGRTVVYFTSPRGVQAAAFASLAPAVTLECGQPGLARGVDHALDYLETCLHLPAVPGAPPDPGSIDLFHTVAIVKITEGVSFGFGAEEADLRLVEDLDHLNFRELPPGTRLGWVRPGRRAPIAAYDDRGRDVAGRYFTEVDGELRTAAALMPSMFTRDPRAIRQDCLGYLMERLAPVDGAR